MKNICTSDGQFRVWCKRRWQYLNAQKRWCSKLMALVESVARCAAFADKPEKYLFVETKEQDRLNVRSKLFTRSLASQLTDVLAHKGGYAIIIDAWYKIGTCLIYYNQAQVTVKVLWRHILRNPLTVTQYYLNIHANTFQLQCKIDPCNFWRLSVASLFLMLSEDSCMVLLYFYRYVSLHGEPVALGEASFELQVWLGDKALWIS